MDQPATTNHYLPVSLEREQIEYYRRRAGEYDEWFLRQGRYDRGPDLNRAWFAEVDQVAAALHSFSPTGRVLELAAGTGLWTQRLIPYADHLTVVDSAPETLALNRARVPDPRVRQVVADLFNWTPDETYDVVFFSFWLSHVPRERFQPFWEMVSSCLAPGGRVFFIDSLYSQSSTAVDHRLEEPGATTLRRRLNDGSEFRIVKVFYEPARLEKKLAALGWQVTVRQTASYFLYGQGEWERDAGLEDR